MIFLIFGGAGFLGQHITRSLLEKFPNSKITIADLEPNRYKIFSYDKDSRVKYLYKRDITKPETYSGDIDNRIDAIFNLAGHISFWKKERQTLYEINANGVRNLCEVLVDRFDGRFIHVSSVAAIGFTDNPAMPADEGLKVDWRKYRKTGYMYTKHLGEKSILQFTKRGLDSVIVNPGLLYGPGDVNTVLPLFRNINSGTLRFYTKGGTGIVDVRDAADGIVAAYRYGKNGNRYILNAHNLTFKEIFANIADKLGKKPPSIRTPSILRVPVKGLISIYEYLAQTSPSLTAETFEFSYRYRYYSSEKAKQELRWEPRIEFNRTISDMVDWYREKELL